MAAITDRVASDSTGFVVPPVATEAILVHKRQAGNPLLSHIRTAPWRFGDVGGPDYVVGRGIGIVFVSLQYHLLHPRYAYKRMRNVGREYRVKVLLVQVDTSDNDSPLQELCRDAMASSFVTLVGWSSKEVARYVEALKAMGNATAKPIMPRQEKGLRQQVTSALTAIRSIQKADVDVLASEFKTVAAMTRSPAARMQSLPGLGATKAKRLLEALQAPFTSMGPEPAARERVGLPPGVITTAQYSPRALSASRRGRHGIANGQQAVPVVARSVMPVGADSGSATSAPATNATRPAGTPTDARKRGRSALSRLSEAVSAWNDSEDESNPDSPGSDAMQHKAKRNATPDPREPQ